MKFVRTTSFTKMYLALDKKNQMKTDETLIRFSQDPENIFLNNHKLHGVYEGCRSLNVGGDYRVIFRELGDQRYELIELLKVGTHSQLYG